MTSQHHLQSPRIEAALDELRQIIATRYPGAEFVVEEGCDPPGTYLVATVDVPRPIVSSAPWSTDWLTCRSRRACQSM